ncbi:Casein kinase I-like 3 isoform 1 [Hibiscus syriacus]|uniref:Casein kinase I-like 3 isoform 1 n=1 Tax=Hibiscus syriacus TaxID=106335 RepID=A0A6A2YI37_HIBSY|nr:Casein kinase I-like 3 isoform 1 [Hibiscus syriacus]
MFTQARPHRDNFSSSRESPTTPQLLLLYSSLALISIGGGGIKSSSLGFGADQLTKRNNVADARTLESYFSWYYVFVQCSALIALTCIVYVQDKLGWIIGFGVPAILMLISCLFFFMESSLYLKLKAGKSLLTGFAQVLSASFRNRHIDSNGVRFFRKGSVLQVPSENLRFLNKTCVINDPQQDLTSDGNASMESLYNRSVIQAGTMDRHITPNFEVPAGSFGVFMIITFIIAIALYDRIAFPSASKLKATVEYIYREVAIRDCFQINRIANACTMDSAILYTGWLGFDNLQSLGASAGSVAASFVTSAVDDVTKRRGESWISSNINKGHYDYYYWLLAVP